MGKHTPGPWIASHIDDETNARQFWVYSADDESVAQADSEANARLIAAAPELLAALQSAMVFLESMNAKCTQDTAFIKNCRAAIAKATGA